MTQYQSIYRKWRPQSFEDIVGQNHITQTLKNAIRMNRIAHAYLFSGPRGVGKTTTARIFAKALNCEKGPTETPCGQCSRCVRISQGQSMDVLEIDGASNRGIEEIRELRSKIGFAPAEGKYKIYIIDEVHMLTDPAFNALLKTLEEPPSQVLFIFATTAPYKVPNTILSRCQSFNFRRISIEEIVEKLKRIADEEKINIDPPSLRLIAESATGSMRDAESILDQVIAYSENKVTAQEVRDILGLLPHKTFYQLLDNIVNHNTETGLKLVDKLVKDGVELNKFVQDFIIYVHNTSLIKVLGKDNLYSSLYFEADELDSIRGLIEKTETRTLLDIIEELKTVEERMKFHHYPWILLELTLVKLTHNEKKIIPQKATLESKSTISKKDVSNKDESAKREERILTLLKKDQDEGISEKKKVEQKDIVRDFDFERLWPKVLSRIKKEKISLYAFLKAGNNVRIEDDQLIINFKTEYLFHKESLEKKENRKKIEEILKEETNCDLKLKCIVEEGIIGESEVSDIIEKENINEEEHSHSKLAQKEKKSNNINEEGEFTLEDILNEARGLFGGEISEE